MSQRQKKRSAQFRKKHYDPRAQKQPSKPPEKDVKSDAKPTQDKVQPATPTSSYESQKYSRRKVVSNWDRYTEGGDEEESEACLVEREETLQRRLVQLLNLPTKPFDEKVPFEEHPVTDGNVPSFLSLDCNALALSLSTLPLHKRLDISLELLELANSDEDSQPEEWNTPSCDLRLMSPQFDFTLPDTSKLKTPHRGQHTTAQDHADELLDVLLAADNSLQRTEISKDESVDKHQGSDLPADTADLDDMLEQLLA